MFSYQSAARAMKKRVIVTHFMMKIIRTYLYKTCNKKIWAAGFHHITARSRFSRGLKLMNRLFI
jgi:hypothetical protein